LTSDDHKTNCASIQSGSSDSGPIIDQSNIDQSNIDQSNIDQSNIDQSNIEQTFEKIQRQTWFPYECQLCNIRATGEETYRTHLEGSLHLRKVEIYNLQMMQMQLASYESNQEMPDMSSPFRYILIYFGLFSVA
jgi:hypothetical protein